MIFGLEEKDMKNPFYRFLFRWIYLPLMCHGYDGEYEKNLVVYYNDRLIAESTSSTEEEKHGT